MENKRSILTYFMFGALSWEEKRRSVFARDNHTCQLCGWKDTSSATLECDHIIPSSRGGSDDISNLQTLCEKCNKRKSDNTNSELFIEVLMSWSAKGNTI
jgi:5-methylcytosine-specific restriction endonuclease McrA